MLDYLEGLLKITNLVLSTVAAVLAISLFRISHEKKSLRAWKVLIFALVFFMVQEVLGALRAFDLFESPFLTHVVPGIILGLLIYALALQIHTHIVEK